jgi:hypothetical protein
VAVFWRSMLPAFEKSMIDRTQMDSDNDDMMMMKTTTSAAHDDINVPISHWPCWAKPKRSKFCTQLNGSNHTQYRPSFHNLFWLLRHWGILTTFWISEAVIEKKHHPTSAVWPWYDFVTVEFELDNAPETRRHQSVSGQTGFYRSCPGKWTRNSLSSKCWLVCFPTSSSEIYKKRSLLVRPWMYEVTADGHPRPVPHSRLSSNIAIIGHIFAIEENPGFMRRYMTASKVL